jgi:hypothetical protein
LNQKKTKLEKQILIKKIKNFYIKIFSIRLQTIIQKNRLKIVGWQKEVISWAGGWVGESKISFYLLLTTLKNRK